MAKYRDLSEDELKTLEKEFIDYLVVNGITADDWVEMKENENEKAEKIVALFSDVILESVLRKINFLEIRTKSYIQSVQCLPEKMIMVAVHTKNKSNDISALNFKDHKNADHLEIFKGEKEYKQSREKELFEMTLQGYEVSDGSLFKSMQIALAE